jgi:hypothetical protein
VEPVERRRFRDGGHGAIRLCSRETQKICSGRPTQKERHGRGSRQGKGCGGQGVAQQQRTQGGAPWLEEQRGGSAGQGLQGRGANRRKGSRGAGVSGGEGERRHLRQLPRWRAPRPQRPRTTPWTRERQRSLRARRANGPDAQRAAILRAPSYRILPMGEALPDDTFANPWQQCSDVPGSSSEHNSCAKGLELVAAGSAVAWLDVRGKEPPERRKTPRERVARCTIGLQERPRDVAQCDGESRRERRR